MGKSTFIDEAKKILNLKHENLQESVKKNIQLAKSNIEINKINSRKRELIFEISKLKANGQDFSKLNDEYNKLNEKEKLLLKNINLSFEDLQEKFNCELCKDKGIVNGKPCICLKNELNEILLKESGVNKNDLPEFGDVDYSLYNESYVKNIKLIFNNMESYINHMSEQKKHIVTISGMAGVGKTFLTECILRRAIELGYYTIYKTSSSLNIKMIDYHTAPLSEKKLILNPYLTCDLLIIDDLGTEPIYNNITVEYLYLIISERLQNNLFTIINTNLNPDQIIDSYGERIFSRIANIKNSMLINMNANDIRLGLRK